MCCMNKEGHKSKSISSRTNPGSVILIAREAPGGWHSGSASLIGLADEQAGSQHRSELVEWQIISCVYVSHFECCRIVGIIVLA
jgi:hypothetical protein